MRGLEPARAARAHAESLGLDVRDALLEDLDPAADGPFDAIVMIDVVEHLEDPVATLRAAAALLVDGGALCVVTPDPSSPTARLAGGRWWGYLPAHTFLLPRRTLRGVLREPGARAGGRRRPVADVLRRLLDRRARRALRRGRQPRSGKLRETALGRRPLTMSLGDERVMVARRAAAAGGLAGGGRPRDRTG